jgi:hypothetical protein
MCTRMMKSIRAVGPGVGVALCFASVFATSRSSAQQVVQISSGSVSGGNDNMTMLDGPAQCPGGERSGPPIVANTFATFTNGSPTQSAICSNPRWVTSNPNDCRFLVDMQKHGRDSGPSIGCVVRASIVPGSSPLKYETGAFYTAGVRERAR